jgi:hypothetical protein
LRIEKITHPQNNRQNFSRVISTFTQWKPITPDLYGHAVPGMHDTAMNKWKGFLQEDQSEESKKEREDQDKNDEL